jgi:hypothetical protein
VGTTATMMTTSTSTSRSQRNLRLRVDLLIILVALLAWGAAFLTPGSRYWDDWVVNFDTLQTAREAGVPWVGYIFAALYPMGIGIFKVIALGATIIVGCTTYEISGRGLGLSPRERLLLAMIMVALPLNSTRMIAVLYTYAWSLALFFVAWYLLVRKKPSSAGRIRYVVATLLLFVSYTTGSLLLFTVIPIAHLAYLATRRDVPLWEGLARFAVRFWYLFLAPVVFWTARTLFFQPFGPYEGYNRLGLAGGMSNPVAVDALGLSATLVFVSTVLVWRLLPHSSRYARRVQRVSLGTLACTTGAMGCFLLANSNSPASTALVVPVTLLLCALILLATAIFPGDTGPASDDIGTEPGNRDVTPILAVGLIALVLAILPYLLVGKLPSFDQWETRHQLLMPLGVGVIIVATGRALSGLFPLSVVRLLAVGLVTISTFASLTISLQLVADWRKQVQVIEALAREPLAQKASIVVFSDQAPELNYDGRGFQFYEYSAWLTGAFGNHSRLGIDETSVRHFINGNFRSYQANASRYGFAGYRKPTRGVLVQIIPLDGASWWPLVADQPSIRLRVTPIDSWTTLATEGDRLRLARSTVGL